MRRSGFLTILSSGEAEAQGLIGTFEAACVESTAVSTYLEASTGGKPARPGESITLVLGSPGDVLVRSTTTVGPHLRAA